MSVQPDAAARALGAIALGDEPHWRPTRLMLAPEISARLDRDGLSVGRLTYFEDGSVEIDVVPTDGAELDPLHPFGRCTCGGGGGGDCDWCRSTCAGCGGEPHEGDCPAFEDLFPELGDS